MIDPNLSERVPDWFREAVLASEAIAARQPFFVVGCQKSGTTWIQLLLDAHPQAACGGEGHFTDILAPAFHHAFRAYNDQIRANCKLTDGQLHAAYRLTVDRHLAGYLARKPDPASVLAVGDKTPEGALALPLLASMYPAARFVHVIRDGRDGCVSGWAHLGRQNEQERFGSFAEYAGYFAQSHWVSYITAARSAAASIPGRYIELRYEDMLDRPEPEAGRLLGFLGLDATDDAIAACLRASDFDRLSGGRRRGESDDSSHFRRGIAGAWTEQFDARAIEAFEREAGELLDGLGYARGAA
ncbi:MAG: sulfotransferase [Planctomycetota bacterium]